MQTGVKTLLSGGRRGPPFRLLHYTGVTAQAYQAAREIPEVLDSLYCYCDCARHSGHKSLLSCYVDEHAVHCDICIDEALMATSTDRARTPLPSGAVDARFAQSLIKSSTEETLWSQRRSL